MLMNAEFIPWMIVGLLGFYLFRENLTRSLAAIEMNRMLFAYRQVKPVDTVLVRCYLEFVLKSFILTLFIIGGSLLEFPLIPDLPIEAMFAWFSLWLLGLGLGLVFSVLSTLVNEVGIIVRVTTLPLLLLSGVMIPATIVPYHLQYYFLLNPIVHGIETLRMAFFEHYVTISGISLMYLWYWALASMLIGLILHKHFEPRLKAR